VCFYFTASTWWWLYSQGDHDINFKRLCSQLNVECGEFDWKRTGNGAVKLGGGGAVDGRGLSLAYNLPRAQASSQLC
jgi:hypothetical protein